MSKDDDLHKIIFDVIVKAKGDPMIPICIGDISKEIKALFNQGHCVDCDKFDKCQNKDKLTSLEWGCFGCKMFKPKESTADKQGD